MTAFIACRSITKSFPKGDTIVTPIDGLDLELDKGSFVALMGPSGSGKTTLLNLIAGIDTPTAGSLVVAGAELSEMSRAQLARWRAENVGYVFQLYNLIPVLTAYENVELPLLLFPYSRAERHRKVSLALDLVGIADRHDHFPRQLSGGQEQRVAIARAIVTDPAVLVADEPTGDLDAVAAVAVLKLLSRLHTELGMTLVMVTHDPRAAAFAGEIIHLDKGKIARREMAASTAAVHPGSAAQVRP